MITRLQVNGFKNLVNVDVRFGPFTCIAGGNGVGKSNLFDAIVFLSRLASSTLLEAASHVRDPDGRSREVRSLFTRAGDTYSEEMQFSVEMVVAPEATDDLGQRAKASITLLRYDLALGYEEGDQVTRPDRLVVRREELNHIKIGQAKRALPFLLNPRAGGRSAGWSRSAEWRKSAVYGRRTASFISTQTDENSQLVVQRHQEGNAGRPQLFDALNLPRTVLSTSNAVEGPTALIARREMESWSLLHFEPTALRRPDDFLAPPRMSADGGHLPATLYRLANQRPDGSAAVYASVANRLAHLIDDVRTVDVDRDSKQELLTLQVEDRDHTRHAARALSDGTLRFLALSVLQEDPDASGVWCLEEPENGLYPARIPAMISLLRDIAVDTDDGVGRENPLRQVVINTHSPGVVQEVPESSLVAAVPVETSLNGAPVRSIQFKALSETWRTEIAEPQAAVISKRFLLDYLNGPPDANLYGGDGAAADVEEVRVVDRPELRQLMLFADAG
jgi:predicted ATPase